jgi:Mg-chelatase subunit ChlD
MAKHCRLLSIYLAIGWLMTFPWAGAAAPADVLVVFDNSAKMQRLDPGFLGRQAIVDFALRLADGSRIALIVFDDQPRLSLPLSDVREPPTLGRLQDALGQINYGGKLAKLPNAMERAIYELKANGRPELERVVVVLTDGVVDHGDPATNQEMSRWLREDLAADAARSGIHAYAAVLGEAADFHLIQSLVQRTGGDYFRVARGEDLAGTLDRVLTRLRPTAPSASPSLMGAGTALLPQTDPQSFATGTAPPVPEAAPLPPRGPAPPDPLAASGTPEKGLGLGIWFWFWIGMGAAAGVAGIGGVVYVVLRHRSRSPAQRDASQRKEGQSGRPRAPPAEAYLKDLSGSTSQPMHCLTGKSLLLGRLGGTATEGSTFLVVKKTTVGRQHALIEYQSGGYQISDQGSKNGTYVNGERVYTPRRLQDGDRIRLHEFEFEFCLGGASFPVGKRPPASEDVTQMSPFPASPARAGPADAQPPPAMTLADPEIIDLSMADPEIIDLSMADPRMVEPRMDGTGEGRKPVDMPSYLQDLGYASLPRPRIPSDGEDSVYDEPTLLLRREKAQKLGEGAAKQGDGTLDDAFPPLE